MPRVNKFTTSLEEEEWVPVKGYAAYYHVSNLGRVRSVPRFRMGSDKVGGNLLTPSPDKQGYCGVYFTSPHKPKRVRKQVHRLVAEAFLPNPENLPQVNHKNLDKSSNSASNLEWCDAFHNQQHWRRLKAETA